MFINSEEKQKKYDTWIIQNLLHDHIKELQSLTYNTIITKEQIQSLLDKVQEQMKTIS